MAVDEQLGEQVELQEEFDEDYEPTTENILEYAKLLGMDPEEDKDLLWICREGLKAPLPDGWSPCRDETTGEVYYFNFQSGDSLWDHPCDEQYRELYQQEKRKKDARSQGTGGGRPQTSAGRPSTSRGLGGSAALSSGAGPAKDNLNALRDLGLSDPSMSPPPAEGTKVLKVSGRMDLPVEEESEDYSWTREEDRAAIRDAIGDFGVTEMASRLASREQTFSQQSSAEEGSVGGEGDLASLLRSTKPKVDDILDRKSMKAASAATAASSRPQTSTGRRSAGPAPSIASVDTALARADLDTEAEQDLGEYKRQLRQRQADEKDKARAESDRELAKFKAELVRSTAEKKTQASQAADDELATAKAQALRKHNEALAVATAKHEADAASKRKSQDEALAKLEAEHAAKLAAARKQHDAEMATMADEHKARLSKARAETDSKEREAAASVVAKENADAVAEARAEGQAAVKRAEEEAAAQLAEAETSAAKKLAAAKKGHAETLERLRQEQGLEKTAEEAILRKLKASRASADNQAAAVAGVTQQQEKELAAITTEHAAKRKQALAALERELEEAKEARRGVQRGELQQMQAEHGKAMSQARRKQADEQEEQEAALRAECEKVLASVRADNEAQLTGLHDEIQALRDQCDQERSALQDALSDIASEKEAAEAELEAVRVRLAEARANLEVQQQAAEGLSSGDTGGGDGPAGAPEDHSSLAGSGGLAAANPPSAPASYTDAGAQLTAGPEPAAAGADTFEASVREALRTERALEGRRAEFQQHLQHFAAPEAHTAADEDVLGRAEAFINGTHPVTAVDGGDAAAARTAEGRLLSDAAKYVAGEAAELDADAMQYLDVLPPQAPPTFQEAWAQPLPGGAGSAAGGIGDVYTGVGGTGDNGYAGVGDRYAGPMALPGLRNETAVLRDPEEALEDVDRQVNRMLRELNTTRAARVKAAQRAKAHLSAQLSRSQVPEVSRSEPAAVARLDATRYHPTAPTIPSSATANEQLARHAEYLRAMRADMHLTLERDRLAAQLAARTLPPRLPVPPKAAALPVGGPRGPIQLGLDRTGHIHVYNKPSQWA